MSFSSEEQLSVALRAQASRDNDPEIAERICEEIKQSTVFRYNWQALLQAAPVAISATGACYAACFSEAGQRVTLNLPLSGQFKYLEYRSLSTNLLLCGDKSRFAFLEAETGLAFVKDVSTRAENKVVDIIECLSDPDPKASQRLLERQMSQLKLMADDCHDKVSAIDSKFDEWLRYTGDLHAACVDTDTTAADKIHETAIDKILKETKLECRSQTMADAKARSEQLGKSLDMASAAFKKASDEFPSGWDLMGQQIVGGIADCAVGSINSFVHAVTNPHLKVAAMASTIGDLLHSNGKEDRKGSSGQDEATPLISHSPETERAHSDGDLDDPAYDLVKRCMTDLDILYALLHNGPDGGVDWHATMDASDRRSSIRFVSGSLRQHLKDCPNSALKNSPSAKLSAILKQCAEIADAVNAESERGRSVSKTGLLAGSKVVQKWQTQFEEQYSSAQKMDAFAKARPGTSSGMPLMASHFNIEAHVAQINARSAQAQATLEAAKYRLHATQGVFMGFQENYTKASQDMLDQQMKMTEIQSALTEPTQKNMGLQEAKIVLERCMMLIVKVKSSIMNLCRFFRAMSLTIEAIVKHSVQPFLENIAAGSSDDDQAAKIGICTFTDLQPTMLYHSAITINANFSVFGDIVAMWCELSEKYIMPGVHMLDQLSLPEPDEHKRQRRVQDLQTWTERSTEGVMLIADKSQREIIESME